MRLGRPLAAASAVAAMTGASLIASPVLANSSNSNSPSTPSSTAEATTPSGGPAQPSPAPSKTSEATPAPSKTAEATPAPSKTSEGSSFKITQEKTFVSTSTNTSFTVSGTGCTGKQATVGIALYAPTAPFPTSSRPRRPQTAAGPQTLTWRRSSSPSARPRPPLLTDGPSEPAA